MYIYFSKKCRISAAAFIAVAFFTHVFPIEQIFPLFLAVTVHELGHIIALKMFGGKIFKITFSSFGGDILFNSESLSHGKLLIIYSFGILFNILSSSVCFMFFESTFAENFLFCSLLFSVVNLIPVSSLDGGKILGEILSLFFDFQLSHTVKKIVSFICLFFLWQCGIYLLLKTNTNFSLFLMCATLFCEFICDK